MNLPYMPNRWFWDDMTTKLVGILNITPDSFSDGGKYAETEQAGIVIAGMIEAGAAVVDIGAESTRPGAQPIDAEEEWRRLENVLPLLKKYQGKILFSIDTRHAQTARRMLDAGVDWVNDVSGFSEAQMVEAMRYNSCKLVVMHSLTVPADVRVTLKEDCDVMAELLAFARARIDQLEKAGIARERIIFDPGIGFNKTTAQSLEILKRIDELRVLEVPLLVGHSRKSFLKEFGDDREMSTLITSAYLAQKDIDYLRVHDVLGHANMLGLWSALNA